MLPQGFSFISFRYLFADLPVMAALHNNPYTYDLTPQVVRRYKNIYRTVTNIFTELITNI